MRDCFHTSLFMAVLQISQPPCSHQTELTEVLGKGIQLSLTVDKLERLNNH